MCGRYSLTVTTGGARRGLSTSRSPPTSMSRATNLAPTQDAPILVRAPEGLRAGPARWGLVPLLGRVSRRRIPSDQCAGARPFTPAQPFETPTGTGDASCRQTGSMSGSQGPHRSSLCGSTRKTTACSPSRAYGSAGTWPDGSPLITYTVLTTDAAPWVAFVHGPNAGDSRRRPHATCGSIRPPSRRRSVPCSGPYGPPLRLDPVSTIVNKASNETPECVTPIGPPVAPPPPELRLDL